MLSLATLGLIVRVCLSRHSVESWQAYSLAYPVCVSFQMICMMITNIVQVFVSHFLGVKKNHLIGPYVWQAIWFSFLSMGFTYPLSFFAESYFLGSGVKAQALQYFRALSLVNFLYPLATSLASFFVGRGKTKIIFVAHLGNHILHALLAYGFIFGIPPLLPQLGMTGAIVATIISQSLLCLVLFTFFLRKENQDRYQTHQWQLRGPDLWNICTKGAPQAFAKMMIYSSWLLSSHLMIERGEDLMLSFFSSLFPLLTPINEAVGQTLITIISYWLSVNGTISLKKILRSSFILLASISTLLAIFLLFYQDVTIGIFHAQPKSSSLSDPISYAKLKECCWYLWVVYLLNGVNKIGSSFIIATKDTIFYALISCLPWLTLYVPAVIFIRWLHCFPSAFFIIDGITTLLLGTICIPRFQWKRARPLPSRCVLASVPAEEVV